MSARIEPPATSSFPPALRLALEFVIALALALALRVPAAGAQERDPHPFAPRSLAGYLPTGARQVSYGPSVAFGGGTARAFVVGGRGATTEVGVLLSREALASRAGQPPRSTTIPLPLGDSTPLRHVALSWSPGKLHTGRTPDATRFGLQLCSADAPADVSPTPGCRSGAYSVRWESAGRQLRIALTPTDQKV
jgi:hypothetical protein